jgi:hypothetical protein
LTKNNDYNRDEQATGQKNNGKISDKQSTYSAKNMSFDVELEKNSRSVVFAVGAYVSPQTRKKEKEKVRYISRF